MTVVTAPVVVAVARGGSDAAVRHGALEAHRSGRPLHLVHVAGDDHYAAQLGRDALSVAARRARGLVDPARTTPRLLVGSVVAQLAGAASGGALLVTERRDPGTALRASTSMTAALAAATDTPLHSVPAGWVPDPRPGIVVTGVDVSRHHGLGHGHDVALRSAVVAALLRHATLRVIATTGPGDDAAARPADQVVRKTVAQRIAAVGGDSCEVALEVGHGRAEDVLVEAAAGAVLLVLGRRRPLGPSGSRLGPVARAVLRDAACPVLLAEPEPMPAAAPGADRPTS